MIELDVHTKGGPMLEKFQELNISEVIIRALNEMGFEEPTPIQAESIPVAMAGMI